MSGASGLGLVGGIAAALIIGLGVGLLAGSPHPSATMVAATTAATRTATGAPLVLEEAGGPTLGAQYRFPPIGDPQGQASKFTGQATGIDWVNGSTFGLIASNLPLGYGYSTASYNGSVYVYYTVTSPNGITWINGVVFKGTYEYPAPLPKFNDLGVASPYITRLPNGSLIMTWFGVPRGSYELSNLTILLQGSLLEPNGTWGPIFNATSNGVALSATSDGRYLYIIWEPTLNLSYTNAELIVKALNGETVASLPLPGAVALNGALNGSVAFQFVNGTYAVLDLSTRGVKLYAGYSVVGFSDGLFYALSNGTLKVLGRGYNVTLRAPSASYAWPALVNGRLYLLAYSPPVLDIYSWNGAALRLLSNYTLPGLVVAKTAYSDGFLYVTALARSSNGTGMTAYLLNIIVKTQSTPTTTTASTTTTTTSSTTSSTTTTTLVPPTTSSSTTPSSTTASTTSSSTTTTSSPLASTSSTTASTPTPSIPLNALAMAGIAIVAAIVALLVLRARR